MEHRAPRQVVSVSAAHADLPFLRPVIGFFIILLHCFGLFTTQVTGAPCDDEPPAKRPRADHPPPELPASTAPAPPGNAPAEQPPPAAVGAAAPPTGPRAAGAAAGPAGKPVAQQAVNMPGTHEAADARQSALSAPAAPPLVG